MLDLLDADVLVLQEYGNDYDVELLKKISYDERVHLIPASLIVEIASTDMGFEYDEMFKPGDYHPSQTYAHLCGLFTFSMISGQDCVKYPLADDEKLMECMKGDSIEEKRVLSLFGLIHAQFILIDIHFWPPFKMPFLK